MHAPDLTTIGVVVGIVAGLGGLGLGIWNRIEQSREHRDRRKSKKPHFEAIASPHADNRGWRPLQFIFYNPSDQAFSVAKIEIMTPGVQIAPVLDPVAGAVGYQGLGTEPDLAKAGTSASIAWKVDPGAQANGSPMYKVFWKPVADPDSFSIRVTAREISASRREFRMQFQAVIRTAKP